MVLMLHCKHFKSILILHVHVTHFNLSIQEFISNSPTADSDIRFCVLSSLDERFDAHLAQAENLSALFVALNDEVEIHYYD